MFDCHAVILFFLSFALSAQLNIDMGYPLLISKSANITNVLSTSDFNLLISFADATATTFNRSFSPLSTTNFINSVAAMTEKKVQSATLTLSNGTSLQSVDLHLLECLDSGRKIHYIYEYATFQLISSLDLVDEILLDESWYFSSGMYYEYLNLYVCRNSLSFFHNSNLVSAINFDVGNGVFANSAVCSGFKQQNLTDTFVITSNFLVFFSNYTVRNMTLTNKIYFNPTTNQFQHGYGFTSTYQTSTSELIIKIFPVPGEQILIVEAESLALYQFNPTSNVFSEFDYGKSCYELQDILLIFTQIYLICSTALIKISKDPASFTILIGEVTNLASNKHHIITDSISLCFYYPENSQQIFKISPSDCTGSAIYDAQTKVCTMFNVTVAHCAFSVWLPQICSICEEIFNLTQKYTCQYWISNLSPDNLTSLLNEVNLTEFRQEIRQFSENYTQLMVLLQQLFTAFQGTVTKLIALPGARCLAKPIFYYFGNFDAMYFFQFHDRSYGQTMTQLFKSLDQIQKSKWAIVDIDEAMQLFGLNLTEDLCQLDYQSQYLTYPYTTANRTVFGSEGLFANNLNFFVFNVPIVVTIFVGFRLLFFLSFKYRISKFFRIFSFWGYLFLICLSGNLQQFIFYLTNDLLHIFAFSLLHKFIKLAIIIFGFGCLMGSFCLLLCSYAFYGKLSKYLLDNNINRLGGILCASIQNGVYSFIMGLFHALLRLVSYSIQIKILIIFEIIFAFFFVLSTGWKFYSLKFRVFICTLLNIQRIVLLFTLHFDYQNQDFYDILDQTQKYLILLMIFTNAVGIIYEIGSYIAQILRNLLMFRSRRRTLAICSHRIANQMILTNRKEKFMKIYEIESKLEMKTNANNTHIAADNHFKIIINPQSGDIFKVSVEQL